MIDKHQRQVKGLIIPLEIWDSQELTLIEKVIFAEVDSYTGNGHSCYMSNETFAKFLNCSESTVSRSINKLIEKGYIDSKTNGRQRFLSSLFIMTFLGNQIDKAGMSERRATNQSTKQITNNKAVVVDESYIDGYVEFLRYVKKTLINNVPGFKASIRKNIDETDFAEYEAYLKKNKAIADQPPKRMPFNPEHLTDEQKTEQLEKYKNQGELLSKNVVQMDIGRVCKETTRDWPDFETIYKASAICRVMVANWICSKYN